METSHFLCLTVELFGRKGKVFIWSKCLKHFTTVFVLSDNGETFCRQPNRAQQSSFRKLAPLFEALRRASLIERYLHTQPNLWEWEKEIPRILQRRQKGSKIIFDIIRRYNLSSHSPSDASQQQPWNCFNKIGISVPRERTTQNYYKLLSCHRHQSSRAQDNSTPSV